MLVDSHCHLDRLDLTPYNGNLDLAIAAAKEKHVEHILCVCIDLDNFPAVISIAEKYANVSASVGVHPTEALIQEPTVDQLVQLASHHKVVALGETGLDFYRDDNAEEIQLERFRRHINAAKIVNKPLIIHTRQAREATIQLLKEENAASVGGVLHCFTEDLSMAQQAIDLNFYISFSGILTFQNAKELKEVAKKIPLERILIETDAPYLAPVPYRGKSNEPAYVYYVAHYLAELRNTSFATIAQVTTENFFNLFKASHHPNMVTMNKV